MIAIVKYNAGNIGSVSNALNRLGCEHQVTDDKDTLQQADKVIFPGVGEASSAMKYLKEKQLDNTIKNLSQPVLGICLGLQLMCQSSEEGNTKGLGIFDTQVIKFPSQDIVPHMGWNNLFDLKTKLFEGINEKNDVYYVHSYFAELCSNTIAKTDYILPFSAALNKNNFFATQFHPEKSASVGEIILKNFISI